MFKYIILLLIISFSPAFADFNGGYTSPPGVTGPSSSTANDCPYFSDGTGKLLGDGGGVCKIYPTALPQPAAPTLTLVGTGNGRSLTYSVIANNAVGHSVPGVNATITNGPATLSGTNYISIQTPSVTGATSCYVVRNDNYASQPGFFINLVGEVACGSTINDTGSYVSSLSPANAPPLSGGVGYPGNNPDGSSALLLNRNEVVNGQMTVGNGPWNVLSTPYELTSSSVQLNVASLDIGNGAALGDPDPVNIQSVMIIEPAGNNYINQPWGFQNLIIVPSSNTYSINALEGISNLIQFGGGNLYSADGLSNVISISGTASTTGQIDATTSTVQINSSANQTGVIDGELAQLLGSGSGSIAVLNGIEVEFVNYGSGTISAQRGIEIDAPKGNEPTLVYEGIRIEDGHTTGSSSSYGLHQVGTSWTSLFEGSLTAGDIFTIANTSSGISLDITSPYLVSSVAIATPGTGALPSTNVSGPNGGSYAIGGTLVVSASVSNAGDGTATPGTYNVSSNNGSGTRATYNVTVNSSGFLASVNSIVNAGDYVANPNNLNSVTLNGGLSGTGATVAVVMGVHDISENTGDALQSCSSPISLTGSGISGLTVTPTCGTFKNTVSLLPSGGKVLDGGIVGYSSTSAPTAACGNFDSHATNMSGTLTVNSGSITSCVVTFATNNSVAGFANWNHCRVTSQSTVANFGYSYTKTAITITGTSLGSDIIDIGCDGN